MRLALVVLLVGCRGHTAKLPKKAGQDTNGNASSLSDTAPAMSESAPPSNTDHSGSAMETAVAINDTAKPDTADNLDTGEGTDSGSMRDTALPGALPHPVLPFLTYYGNPTPLGDPISEATADAIGKEVDAIVNLQGDGETKLVIRMRERNPSGFHTSIVTAWAPDGGRVNIHDHAIASVRCTGSETHPAGDGNGDGIGDAWFDWRLMAGPMHGDLDCDADDDARLVEYLHGEDLVTGDFDADGDGHADAVVSGHSAGAMVHYGPFSGDIPGYFHEDFDPEKATYLKGDCGDEHPFARAVGGIGTDGGMTIAVGNREGKWCEYSTVFFDMKDARGKSLYLDDRLSHIDWWNDAETFGDWNSDGIADMMIFNAVVLGPLKYVGEDMPRVFGDDRSHEGCAVGVRARLDDMTGDGLSDVLLKAEGCDAPFRNTYWVAPGGSFNDGDPFSFLTGAVHIDIDEELTSFPDPSWSTLATGDFDGDGKGDFALGRYTYDDYAGRVWVWRGADLFP
jgi:hypothetical protein